MGYTTGSLYCMHTFRVQGCFARGLKSPLGHNLVPNPFGTLGVVEKEDGLQA